MKFNRISLATRCHITDADGKYTIDVINDQSMLVFSFVGYITQEVSPGGRTSMVKR